MTPLNLAAGALTRLERAARSVRRRLLRTSGTQGQLDHTNDADQWSRLYNAPHPVITRINSPVARVLERLSRPGEVLLETGCGSASISAELSLAGRKIELADFSQEVLARARNLFERSNLPIPKTTLADLSKPLPWPNSAVDITWSSGVLEHWTDDELVPIVSEMARISRRLVVSLVPYAGSVMYRWGKWSAEKDGRWEYGRELPRQTLRPLFEKSGLHRVNETTLWSDKALAFLSFVDPETQREATRWWESLPEDDLLRQTQGYLLLTTGEIA